MGEAVKRISAVINAKEETTAAYDLYEATVRRSFVLSSDQAHALHPNYASKVRKFLFSFIEVMFDVQTRFEHLCAAQSFRHHVSHVYF